MQAGRGRGQGRRTRGAENVPLMGSRGSGHACTSPSGGSAALCAPACHGKGQGRRISPRMGGKGDGFGAESVPLARSRGSRRLGMPRSASREKLHATGGGEGEAACYGMQQGGSCTPRETAREKVPFPLPPRPLLPRGISRQRARLHVALGRFRGTLRGGRPWKAPKATDFATDGAEGDGFGPESFPLARSRGSGGRGVPAARVVSS